MKFDLILADPAWAYDDTMDAGNRGASHKYSLMTIDAIKALPVQHIAAKDSELWIWGTWPLLKECLEVVDAWGFRYHTIGFDWMKIYKSGKPFMGGGHGTRSNTEYCLRAKRGEGLKRMDDAKGVPSAILSVPSKIHSRKPPEARERLLKLFGPNLNRVELFATDRCDGFLPFGFDIDGRDLRDSIPALIDPNDDGSFLYQLEELSHATTDFI